MQQLQFPSQFVRPNGAASAYGTIIRTTESPREIECRVFEQVTAALEAACDPEVHFAQKIKAMHDNRLLWQTLAADLADDGNELPGNVRAHLISLAIWVGRETDRVQSSDASPRGLVDINHIIMQGLRPGRRIDAPQA
ncbi:MAG: flagellar biosynthesis regulator FlaF [Alphaproteobacteria bacterium]|nr:flagellar biosynthesis regulator FlaF [Alphaproteobacteria bacterium]